MDAERGLIERVLDLMAMGLGAMPAYSRACAEPQFASLRKSDAELAAPTAPPSASAEAR